MLERCWDCQQSQKSGILIFIVFFFLSRICCSHDYAENEILYWNERICMIKVSGIITENY